MAAIQECIPSTSPELALSDHGPFYPEVKRTELSSRHLNRDSNLVTYTALWVIGKKKKMLTWKDLLFMGSSIADDWTECVNANEMCRERIWMDLWKN